MKIHTSRSKFFLPQIPCQLGFSIQVNVFPVSIFDIKVRAGMREWRDRDIVSGFAVRPLSATT